MATNVRSFDQVHPICMYLLKFTGLKTISRSKLAWERSKWLQLSVVFWILFYATLVILILKAIFVHELTYAQYWLIVTTACHYLIFIVTACLSLTHQDEAIEFFEEQERLLPKYPRSILGFYQKRMFAIPTILILIVLIPGWLSSGESYAEITLRLTSQISPIVYDFYIICVSAPLIHMARRISHRIKKLIKNSRGDSFILLDSVPKLSKRKLFSKMKCPYDSINSILLRIQQARQLTAKYNLVSGGFGRE